MIFLENSVKYIIIIIIKKCILYNFFFFTNFLLLILQDYPLVAKNPLNYIHIAKSQCAMYCVHIMLLHITHFTM